MPDDAPVDAVTFDCFGTLVAVDPPVDTAAAVADALAARGVDVPGDWADAYGERHLELADGEELSLPDHARAALASRGRDVDPAVTEAATLAAFDAEVRTREAAPDAVAAAAARGPVGVLSNCAVPGLVEHVLDASGVDAGLFDAVVTSVDCGWRKPDERAFRAAADALGVAPAGLLHVGDQAEADGGVETLGGRSRILGTTSLSALVAELEAGRWD